LPGGEVIVADNLPSGLEQAIDQIAADEARGAGDEGGVVVRRECHGQA